MSESHVLARIDAWLRAGLIDDDTAARLRDAEAAADDGAEASERRGGFPLALVFGPGVTVGEMFGYLGSAFLLAAWITLTASSGDRSGAGTGLLIAGLVIAVLGYVVRASSPRLGRAAGVALLAAGALLGGGTFLLVDLAPTSATASELAGAAAWLVAAVAFRRVHRALLTQVGLIGSVLAAAAAMMDWLEDIILGPSTFTFDVPDSPMKVVLLAIGWGIAAVVLGVVGLIESRGSDPAAGTRAALTRLAAGLTAVLGTATAVFASGSLGEGRYGRLIEPAIGDAALVVVSVVLLERAFRREASAFVYPAALGVIIGLSDLNASYLSAATSPEFALLVEGVILLAAGVGFDRLRRRVGAPPSSDAERVIPAAGAGPA